ARTLLRRAADRRGGAGLGDAVRVLPADRDCLAGYEGEDGLADVGPGGDRRAVQRGDDVSLGEAREVGGLPLQDREDSRAAPGGLQGDREGGGPARGDRGIRTSR